MEKTPTEELDKFSEDPIYTAKSNDSTRDDDHNDDKGEEPKKQFSKQRIDTPDDMQYLMTYDDFYM